MKSTVLNARRLVQLVVLLPAFALAVGCGGTPPDAGLPGLPVPGVDPNVPGEVPPGCRVVSAGLEGTRIVCDQPTAQPPAEPNEPPPPSEPPPGEPPPPSEPAPDMGAPDAEPPPPPPAPDMGAPDETPPPPPPPVCASEALEPEVAPQPNLLLTVDHSQSMTYPPGDGSTASKWTQLVSAINQVVPAVDDTVRWGLAYYPAGASACGTGKVAVDVGDRNGGEVTAGLVEIGPPGRGGTPTSFTLDLLRGYAELYDPSRPSFVLLATDGRPTCKNGDFDDITGADDAATRAAVTALREAGIRTFIVGFGTSVNTTNAPLLNDLATLGGTDRTGTTKYYSAASLSDLEAALDDIGAKARCSYTLGNVPNNPDGLTVTFDGQPVAASGADGWQFDAAANTVSFNGASCDAIFAGQVTQIDVGNICP